MNFGSGDAKYVVCFNGTGDTQSASMYSLTQLQYNNGGFIVRGIVYTTKNILDNSLCTITFAYNAASGDTTVLAKEECTIYNSQSSVPIHLNAGESTTISIGGARNENGIAIVFYD